MKKVFVFLLAAASVAGVSSCSKSSSPSTNAQVMFVNSCIGATATSLTVNGTSLSNATSVAYLKNSGYQSVASGSVVFNAVLNGTGSLGTTTQALTAGDNYSIFVGGSVLADSLFFIPDNLPKPTATFAYVRFVNASADTSARTMTATVGTNVVGTNIAYATGSSFVQVSPGTYNVLALNTSNPSSAVTAPNTQFSGGKIYTILYSGNSSSSSSGFTVTIVNNN